MFKKDTIIKKSIIIGGIGIVCAALGGAGLVLHLRKYANYVDEGHGTFSNAMESTQGQNETDPGQGQNETDPSQGQDKTQLGYGQNETNPGRGQNETESGQGQNETAQAAKGAPYNQIEPTREDMEPLAADVVIGSSVTVSALAMGTVAEVDLDGDGVAELVQVGGLEEDPYWEAEEPYNDMTPAIQVNRKFFDSGAVRSAGVPGGDDLDVATYYILDVDVNDPYREIGIYYQGYTVSPHIYLLRYGNGLLACVGSMDDVYPIPFAQSCDAQEWRLELGENPDADYQKMLDSIVRDEILMNVPGDGTVTAEGYASGYCHSVQDEITRRTWELQQPEDFHARLVERELEEYEFMGWPKDWGDAGAVTNRELQVYANKSTKADVITIPPGTKIAFSSYCPDGGWLQMAYGSPEQAGWFQLERMLASSTGVGVSPSYYRYYLVMPNGRFLGSEVFDNLQFLAGR